MARPRRKTRSFDLASGFSYFIPNLKEVAFIILFYILGYLIATAVGLGLLAAFGRDFFMTYAQLIVYPIMFVPAVWYCSIKSRRNEGFDYPCEPIDRNGWKGLGAFWAFLLCFIGVIGLGFAVDPLEEILPEMSESLKAALEAIINGPLWSALLATAVFAPICEEWLCRGMILRGLLKNTKLAPVWAILIQAAIFAGIHANIWQAIPAFLLGSLFGYVYFKTGSLKLTMFMHCVNNTISVILSRTLSDECASYHELFGDNPLYWVLIASGVILTVLVCLRFSKIRE